VCKDSKFEKKITSKFLLLYQTYLNKRDIHPGCALSSKVIVKLHILIDVYYTCSGAIITRKLAVH
jgi:hypothetical protein